jgi:hypothetical protein
MHRVAEVAFQGAQRAQWGLAAICRSGRAPPGGALCGGRQ